MTKTMRFVPRFGIYDADLSGVRQVACHEISIVVLLSVSRKCNSCVIGIVTEMSMLYPRWHMTSNG